MSEPNAGSGEKISFTVRPSSWPRERPRNVSIAALTRTTRESCVNSIRPSCRLAIIWSTLLFNAEKISRASRICRPRFAILTVTCPYSSCPVGACRAVPFVSAMLSRLRLMCSNGPSARFERPAARISEHRTAIPESISARCSRGVSSFRRKTVDTPT